VKSARARARDCIGAYFYARTYVGHLVYLRVPRARYSMDAARLR